jgi:hypothetical protein
LLAAQAAASPAAARKLLYTAGGAPGATAAVAPSLPDALRARLAAVGVALSLGLPTGAAVACDCADYCRGNCFAVGCGVCRPSAFSFRGGEASCYNPGPFGLGLLCSTDPSGKHVIDEPCCQLGGKLCALPSACDCAAAGAGAAVRPAGDPELFPSLEGRGRLWDNETSTCLGTPAT